MRKSILPVMADTLDATPRTRRRRSDAQRSIDAIVSGARTLLGGRPDASMEEVATAAGLTRQTVYAHFPSRDALIAAVINAERAEGLAAVDAARLDKAPPIDALRQFLDISWQLIEHCPLLLDPTLARTPGPDGGDPHRTRHCPARAAPSGEANAPAILTAVPREAPLINGPVTLLPKNRMGGCWFAKASSMYERSSAHVQIHRDCSGSYEAAVTRARPVTGV